MEIVLLCQLNHPSTLKLQLVNEFIGHKLILTEVSAKKLQDKVFLAKNPFGKLPVLQTKEGYLYESTSIMKHLVKLSDNQELVDSLLGSDDYERSLVDQYLLSINNELEPIVNTLVNCIYGRQLLRTNQTQTIENDIEKVLAILNEDLKLKTFMVGHRLTVVDVYMAQVLSNVFRFYLDASKRSSIKHLTRWFNNIAQMRQFINVNGKITMCQSSLTLVHDIEVQEKQSNQQQKQSNQQQKQSNQQPKKQQQKQQQQPKKQQQQKKEQPKKEENVEDVFKKKMNPLDELPMSKFNLFDFKTDFVNSTNVQDTFKWLWENFDAEGYSFWKVKYDKYTGEGEKLFATNNLVGGFMQRLDNFRKYAFAVHGVYGDEPNLDIKGLWLWRGTDIPQEIKEHVSYEYHFFTKLDISKKEDRDLVEEYWGKQNEDQDVVEGQTLRTFKYFK